jgi:protein involved in polysaccharide export with SLBB domain
MKTVISLTFLTFVVLSSVVSTAAQETAGAMPVRPALTDSNGAAKSAEPLLTEIYRVGTGDILDIRLINSPTNRSTLFTVLPSGAIDLPVAGGAVQVAGLTTEEIQVRIGAELKRRAVEDGAHISVGVRQYVSHSVMVTGLVVNPGTRFLRREAVPLYVVLAESQLRNDAGRVVVMRGGATGETLELSDPQTMNITIQAGDVITVSNKPQEFYYIGGRINYPGQKQFQPGITLLQAILAAGGTTSKDTNVEISREGAGGKLVTVSYNLKQIKSGAVQDPRLAPGDRIEVAK